MLRTVISLVDTFFAEGEATVSDSSSLAEFHPPERLGLAGANRYERMRRARPFSESWPKWPLADAT